MLPPRLAGSPQVSFVHEHQVVGSELADGNPLDPLPLGEFVDVEDLDRPEEFPGSVGGEEPGTQAARVHLPPVLLRHALVGRQQDHGADTPSGPLGIVPVLLDVDMHEQCLAGASRALEGQGFEIGRLVRWETAIAGAEASVQLHQQLPGLAEVAVEVVLGEEQRQVLVGLQAPAVLHGQPQSAFVPLDVAVVHHQLRWYPAIGVPERFGALFRIKRAVRARRPRQSIQ